MKLVDELNKLSVESEPERRRKTAKELDGTFEFCIAASRRAALRGERSVCASVDVRSSGDIPDARAFLDDLKRRLVAEGLRVKLGWFESEFGCRGNAAITMWWTNGEEGAEMKRTWLMWVFALLGGMVLALGVTWIVQGNDFFLYRCFAPKYEQVRRETFEQSKAYNEGMAQELQRMQFEYVQADDEHKAALASIILHRVADYDESRLPPDLHAFVESLRQERSHAAH